ncbi:MAG: outer membrane lipoprotein carrier protein LolA [Treponema sp.]|nr:outer membrane lipoprotein carrier protein LolA [Treponema sp.]
MKKAFSVLLLAACFFAPAFSQSILTASEFFKSVSDHYGKIQDYEADTQIIVGNGGVMKGKASFKRPEMLRIDFSQPNGQTILFNGETLVIYLPGSSAILQQTVSGSGAAAATPEGLSLMKRYYTVAYESGQTPVPLEDGSSEMVVNLILRRRSASEAFSKMLLSVDPDSLLIRRIVATTPANLDYVFYFSGYNLNTGMSDQRFIYDPPSSANNYNNFLFSE